MCTELCEFWVLRVECVLKVCHMEVKFCLQCHAFEERHVGDSELCIPTNAKEAHLGTEIVLYRRFYVFHKMF